MSGAQAAKLSVIPRRWYQRGHADHGWLKTFHTFSFANYYDPSQMSFSNLRVLNEDRVSAGTGFGTHAHREAEIFSIVLEGELEHHDSMGNIEVLKRGDIQFTSAGTGIRHSEKNAAPRGKNQDVHFLQIWYNPDVSNLPPRYYSTHTPEESKRDTLKTLIKPFSTFSKEEAERTGLLPPGQAIPSHSTLVTRSSILSSSKSVEHILGIDSQAKAGDDRWIYIHLAQTSGYKSPRSHQPNTVNEKEARIQFDDGNGKQYTLHEGDGAYIRNGKAGESITITNPGSKDAEFVLFDLRAE